MDIHIIRVKFNARINVSVTSRVVHGRGSGGILTFKGISLYFIYYQNINIQLLLSNNWLIQCT